MRKLFASLLYSEMVKNDNIFLITGDMGYKMWDRIRDDFPSRYINVGAAEQSMLDISVGISLENKIPIVYSITPFLLFRGFETIRTYINYEKIPVKLVGSGRDKDYEHDGISHWAIDDVEIISTLKNIETFRPNALCEVSDLFPKFLYNKSPSYINLTRKKEE